MSGRFHRPESLSLTPDLSFSRQKLDRPTGLGFPWGAVAPIGRQPCRPVLFVMAVLMIGVCARADDPAGNDSAAKAAPATTAASAPSATDATEKKAEQPANKPEQKPEAKPEAKPAAKSAEKPEAKPAEKSGHQPAGKAEKPAEKKPAAPPAPKVANVVRFTLRGSMPEGPAAPGLFAELQTSLSALIERFDAVAADKSVAAVWLRIEDLAVGYGKLQELRDAIARMRAAGKFVVAELTNAETAEYLVASACDRVVLAPCGNLLLPGVRAEVTFYKGLFDKLGIEFDMMQMGKFKGAAEPFTRAEMSDEFRENMTAIIDDVYERQAELIAGDRGMKDYQVKVLIDQGLFTPSAAQRAKLVDQVAYADQIESDLRKRLKVDQLKINTRYRKKQVDADFSGIGGFMKFMELLMGGKPGARPSKNKQIAVIYAVGAIVEGKSEADLFGESTVGSSTIVAAIRQAAENPKVAAIVLRIDSPGGSATASDLIWREVTRCEKPVIASMGDVAASGGYYIAMGADKILAAPTTITGSIGVVGGKVVLRGLYDKLGLTTETISRGDRSGTLSSNSTFSPEERKAWQEMMRETYRQFVDKAAQGRKKPRRELEEMAQGRVYTGRQALDLGLVDQLGTLRDAIAEARSAAGLKDDEPTDILVLPEPKSFFEQLLGLDEEVSLRSAVEPAVALWPEAAAALGKVRTIRKLVREPVLMWMPYEVRLK